MPDFDGSRCSRGVFSALVTWAYKTLWEGIMKLPRRRFLHLAASALALPVGPRIASAQNSVTAQGPYMDRYMMVNGLRLHYLDRGLPTQPTMILLHGIARHAHTFDHIAPEFVGDYRVIAFDMRGHGDSAWSSEGAYLVEDHVRDLEAAIRELGLARVTLWGNSTGGRVVQVYAGLHPEMVERLIVEDVGPERPQNVADGFARRVQREAEGWASEDDLVKQLRTQLPRTPEPIVRAYAHFGTRRRPDGRLVWKFDPNLVKGFVETELWQYVSKITSPTIYVIGGASPIVPAETQQRLKNTLPNCEVVLMPGLGHYPNEENTAGFLTIVNRFLKPG
jgi:pimeloyl-ACP methyl ester carboxylesterase